MSICLVFSLPSLIFSVLCSEAFLSALYNVPFLFQNAFKTFLGIVPTIANWNTKGDEFSLILDQNPLTDFVELPEDHPNLLYSNVICGVIRGALEMVKGLCVYKLQL